MHDAVCMVGGASVYEPNDDHYWLVASRILEGKVVPFLGAGANLCGRPDGRDWKWGEYLPSGRELAKVLVDRSRYPVRDESDLLRVSQYVGAVLGERALYEYLHSTFDADYPPTVLHQLLADLPSELRARKAPPLLILTTNYDDALERALKEREEAFDVLWYEAKRGTACGHFIHRSADGAAVVDRPNESAVGDERTVILKLHGAVDRENPRGDSYVITEDHYIQYLSRGDIAKQIPVTLRERLADSHLLFLGYSLRDWNLRVILQRIYGEQTLDLKSWAIQREQPNAQLSSVEQRLWADRGDVDLLYVPLDTYVRRLRTELFPKVPA